MTAKPREFQRNAMLQGNKAGKLPTPHGKKWGWWYWPLSTVVIAGGTYWGAQHIERQVEVVAPVLLEEAGIDPSGLQFDATYRHVNVSGILPTETSPEQVELVLAKYTGPNGESIRSADVQATAPVAAITTVGPVVETVIESPTAKANIQVGAMINGEKLTLVGSVPSSEHASILYDAAQLAFEPNNIENLLTVAALPAAIEDADSHINNLAAVLSNMDSEVIDAELSLDNELLTGSIYTANSDSQRKFQAITLDTPVTVVASAVPFDTPMPVTEPVTAPDHAGLLQSEIASLEAEIRDTLIFAPSSDELPSSAFAVLQKVALAMAQYPEANIEIGGHTDSQSSADSNIILSENRARAVANYIAKSGVDSQRLLTIGYGESHPLVSNDTPANRAKNRRVEFWAHLNN